jgi:hypothetical protein
MLSHILRGRIFARQVSADRFSQDVSSDPFIQTIFSIKSIQAWRIALKN